MMNVDLVSTFSYLISNEGIIRSEALKLMLEAYMTKYFSLIMVKLFIN